MFSSIFAQDTIANSNYNSLQVSLEKRFSHGLQFAVAYTFSKSIDQASSFEGNPESSDPRCTRSLSQFDARHRLVFSYYWELPIPQISGLPGKVLNGWAVSGITTYQTGFPIRITSSADNELMYSFDFELPGEPEQWLLSQTQTRRTNGGYCFDPNSFTENASDTQSPPCSAGAVFGCFEPSLLAESGTATRTICCGPRINNMDFAVTKMLRCRERESALSSAPSFSIIFNHSQFINPDGNTTRWFADFGRVKRARDPRLMQFALKFYF